MEQLSGDLLFGQRSEQDGYADRPPVLAGCFDGEIVWALLINRKL